MESQPQNPKFRNNPENFHPYMRDVDTISVLTEILVKFIRHNKVSAHFWFTGRSL